MRFHHNLAAAITGTAIVSALVITLPQKAQALTGKEISEIARNITVLIKGQNDNHGSGFIISKNGDTYYVLTANHVVAHEDTYVIMTHDQEYHQLDNSKVRHLSGSDLAVIEFTSDRTYQTAKLADSNTAKQGSEVFVSGWPRLTTVGKQSGSDLIRQFTDGQISGLLSQPLEGYAMSYTNTTLGGMSGGPVLDTGGRVVGVHGLGDTEDSDRLLNQGYGEEAASLASLVKTGFNYAIPINTFLDLAAQQRIYMNLAVETTAPNPLGAAYVASGKPDPRDRVAETDVLNKINEIFGPIRDGVNTIQRVCGLFGC
ncbi:MAG: trypsin-like peptidase domain-containing protein [Moorea sp. SIO3C2]|nr:trypsin-like peptidase domain-containing protein [Moorena sp. SIO3C2]